MCGCALDWLDLEKPMELMGGIEPPTSSLPRMRSTPELHEQSDYRRLFRDRWAFESRPHFSRAVTKTPGSPGKSGPQSIKADQCVKKNRPRKFFLPKALKIKPS